MSGSFEHPLIAEVYDAIPSHQNHPDVEFYTRFATESAGWVLELGSGTGRVLVPIVKVGKTVYGLEASRPMLDRCRKNLDSGFPEVRDNVELVQGKMQGFDLRNRFGLVICPFNSFLHLLSVEDQVCCLNRVRQHLDVGGRFAFDVFDPDIRRMTSARFTEASQLQQFTLPTGSTIELRHRNKSVDFPSQMIESEIRINVTQRDGSREQVVHPVQQRYIFRYEAEHLLERCGFEVEALYSDFQGSPHDAGSQGSLVFVAKKRYDGY